MKKYCSYEHNVLDCLKSGDFNGEIKEHIKRCSSCSELVDVYLWMGKYKEISMENTMDEKLIPDPEKLWSKAQSFNKYDREKIKKAMQQLLIPQILTSLTVIIGIVILISSHIEEIKDFFSKSLRTDYVFNSLTSTVTKLFTSSVFITIPMALILSSMVIYFLYSIFRPRKV